jgi:hypothetical protein
MKVCADKQERNGMKTLVAAIFAAGVSLTLSPAQAITLTAAPLAAAAKETSSVVEVQGCGRGYMMGSRGCEPISWNYKRSTGKKKKHKK